MSWQAVDDPHGALLDDARAAWAAVSRERRETLARTAATVATFTGAIRDLAERYADVQIDTVAGRRHRGAIVAVARDHLTLLDDAGTTVLLALHAVRCVRPRSTGLTAPPTGARGAPTDRVLDEELERLAESSELVTLALAGGHVMTGRIVAVGEDVTSLRTEFGGSVVYVRTGAVDEIVAAVVP